MKKLSFLMLVAVMVSCSTAVHEKADIATEEIEIPEDWSSEANGAGKLENDWWKRFGDPQLEEIIEEALENSRDLRIAALNVDAAIARFQAARADYYPNASFSAGASKERQLLIGLDIPGAPDILKTASDRKSLELGVSWEVDIWGKFRYLASSAGSLLSAEKHEYEYARLSLIANICRSYFEIAAIGSEISAMNEIIDTENRILAIIKQRYNAGLLDASSLHRQSQLVKTFMSELQSLKKLNKGIVRGLEVMIGRYPSGQLSVSGDLPSIDTRIPAGIPADIISKRPDVIAAQQRLISSGYDLAASKTDLYPKIALTASGGSVSKQFRDLLNGNFSVWSLLGSVTQPLFEGGKIRSKIRVSEAIAGLRLETYLKKVMNSFYEVEDGITTDQQLRIQYELLSGALSDMHATYEMMSKRYRSGMEDPLEMLRVKSELGQLKRKAIKLKKDYIINRINLYLALGGGFDGNI